jgi:hypothetical protein
VRVFIGYDPRQPIAFTVAAHSIWSRASQPVEIIRLQLSQLPITRKGLTEFTYSRFLVPYLSGFTGYSLFVDADVLCLGDITILKASDPLAAVSVVPHERKFERPSVMLFNCKRCSALTPAFVDDPRHPLFDFAWAPRVGTLPHDWNHLVGYDTPGASANLLHFTQGVPVWPETAIQDRAGLWTQEAEQCMVSVSFTELMGPSVHPIAQAKRKTG